MNPESKEKKESPMSKKVVIFFVTSGAIKATPPEGFDSMTEAQRLAWANKQIEATPASKILKEVENAMCVIPHPPAVCLDEDDSGEILASLPVWYDYKEAQGLGAERDGTEKAIREAVERLEAAGTPEDTLDEEVHDLASCLGSDANNAGFEGQARFIARHSGVEELQRVVRKTVGG